MIIVDTSVLIPFLKGSNTKETRALTECENDEIPFCIPVICAQEVLQGALQKKEFNLLKQTLLGQKLISVKDEVNSHIEAANIYFDCRRKGLTVRSTIDCLIAQIALENDAYLLHADKDFKQIKKIRPLKMFG